MKLYKRNLKVSLLEDIDKNDFIKEYDGSFKWGDVLEIDGQLYKCGQAKLTTDEDVDVNEPYTQLLLDPIGFIKPDHCEELETYEDAWTCPLCGYEDYESYELTDSSDDYKCPVCGATTEYEVEHIAKYTVKLIKAPEIKEV